jgi:hypothetical protein
MKSIEFVNHLCKTEQSIKGVLQGKVHSGRLIKLSFDFFSAGFSSFKIKISAIDIIMVQERNRRSKRYWDQ